MSEAGAACLLSQLWHEWHAGFSGRPPWGAALSLVLPGFVAGQRVRGLAAQRTGRLGSPGGRFVLRRSSVIIRPYGGF